MTSRVQELKELSSSADSLAREVSGLWDTWNKARAKWLAEQEELRNYIFAVDTSTTSNADNGWKNKTTIPKLCQIRDNLYANYMSALFPNEEWLRWEGYSFDDNERQKAQAIEWYMLNKFRESNSYSVVGQLALDYIDSGNAFFDTEFVREYKVEEDGTRIPKYIGPRLVRIAYDDIVFNPVASSFQNTPKIIRSMMSVGDIERAILTDPDKAYLSSVLPRLKKMRELAGAVRSEDFSKSLRFSVDGFGNLNDYFASGYVEVLELRGDVYDKASNTLVTDSVVTVVDRMFIARNAKLPSWGGNTIRHVRWRTRPDNLWGMGPLNNLVGMQYRIDHLENLKADVFDMIAVPMQKIRGDVPNFKYKPGGKIRLLNPEDDVDFLHPDVTALNADTQISILEAKMEMFAGAPREAMGIRSPGEKTAFEYQSLITAAGRIFQEKTENFEINGLELALNDALEVTVRNMDAADVIRVHDDSLGVVTFMNVTKEDITAKGKLRPIGARHFSAQAQLVQNLTGLANTPIWSTIAVHLSSKQLAKMVEDVLGLDRFSLFQDNVAIIEQLETQRVAGAAQEQLAIEQQTPPEEMM